MSSASKVLSVARKEIGVKESPPGSNRQKYGKEYGANGQPWCAIFDWWVFKHAGCPELFFGGKKSAYCPTIADYYIAKKQTVSKSSGKPGDIVLFDFNHNNSSDHIGIIEKKNSNGTYTTIEGNTGVGNNTNGGQVMRRIRYQSDISWIVRPKYTQSSSSSSSSSSSKLSVDGKWGKNTTKKTQKVLGTTQDGIVSNQLTSCKKYLENCLTESWSFSNKKGGSPMVKAIQKLVGSTKDGQAGKNTVKAMQKYLNKKGYSCGSVDGYMGSKTVKAWQKYINSKL